MAWGVFTPFAILSGGEAPNGSFAAWCSFSTISTSSFNKKFKNSCASYTHTKIYIYTHKLATSTSLLLKSKLKNTYTIYALLNWSPTYGECRAELWKAYIWMHQVQSIKLSDYKWVITHNNQTRSKILQCMCTCQYLSLQ